MKITIEPTRQLIVVNGTMCRQWQGHTESGTPVIVFVGAIGVPDEMPEEQRAAFDRELAEAIPAKGPTALAIVIDRDEEPSGPCCAKHSN